MSDTVDAQFSIPLLQITLLSIHTLFTENLALFETAWWMGGWGGEWFISLLL